MSWLVHLPALVKVGVCFGGVIVASRLKVNLGLALGAGGVLLGVWMGMGPGAVAQVAASALTSALAIRLAAIVVLILGLSHLMASTGQLKRIVETFSALVRSPKAVAAVMPALIGLLPMPGGALFSAPMVESACCSGPEHPHPLPSTPRGAALLAVVNYWFRHHGEYWWPLYPGLILCVALLGVPTWRFMALTIPIAALHLAAGAAILLPRLKLAAAPARPRGKLRNFVSEAAPIWVVAAAPAVVGVAHLLVSRSGASWPLPEGSALIMGLVAAIAVVGFAQHLPLGQVFKALGRPANLGMVTLVGGVVLFQAFMKGSGAVGQVQAELRALGIPTVAMVLALPFISGVLTGIAVGYVAASFPLVLPLVHSMAGADMVVWGMVAFVAGFVGMMLSPVHLCFLLSRDYFKAPFSTCYRLLVGPLAVVCAGLMAWWWVLS